MGSIETWCTHQGQRINRIGIKISTAVPPPPGGVSLQRRGTACSTLLRSCSSWNSGFVRRRLSISLCTSAVVDSGDAVNVSTACLHHKEQKCISDTALIEWEGNLPELSLCLFWFLFVVFLFLLKTPVICIMVSDCLKWDWCGIGRLISQLMRELGLGFVLILSPCTKSF